MALSWRLSGFQDHQRHIVIVEYRIDQAGNAGMEKRGIAMHDTTFWEVALANPPALPVEAPIQMTKSPMDRGGKT